MQRKVLGCWCQHGGRSLPVPKRQCRRRRPSHGRRQTWNECVWCMRNLTMYRLAGRCGPANLASGGRSLPVPKRQCRRRRPSHGRRQTWNECVWCMQNSTGWRLPAARSLQILPVAVKACQRRNGCADHDALHTIDTIHHLNACRACAVVGYIGSPSAAGR